MKSMKKHVSVVGLLDLIRKQFCHLPDPGRHEIKLVDCLMSGLAVFMLKAPSLLDFDEKRKDPKVCHNLQTLFGVSQAPCDTYLRERLDEVSPRLLRAPFKRVFAALQRSKALEAFIYYDQSYLLSIDGTGYFASDKVQCSSCCVKEHRDGRKSYYHQALGAVIVHPDHKVVIPIAPEPIIREDGARKNDCERHASTRLLEDLRREHPHLRVIVVADSLSANAPHINLLRSLDLRFILGAKSGDHQYLFEFVNAVTSEELEEKTASGVVHRYRWVANAPLNGANERCEVNFLEYWEIRKTGKTLHFSWVTDLPLNPATVRMVMRGGRSRWRIENETFNTLKNQGYHFEHNFGHGHKYLSTVFAYLMFLAFLVDQIQQHCCEFFTQAWQKMKRKKYLWELMRSLFVTHLIASWQSFYAAITYSRYGGTIGIDTS